MERVLAYVVQGDTAQMADPAFAEEPKTWIRFNGSDAVLHRDGLFSVCSGSPAIPSWLRELAPLVAGAPGRERQVCAPGAQLGRHRGLRRRFGRQRPSGGRRPDLVVRFGRWPTLPPWLRRPVESVMV